VNIVAIGGGTGLPVVLTGLRRYLTPSARITAVVTAADDGGSSGVLRKEYGVLPPGDIRNCLLALARVKPEVRAALQYRFDGGGAAQHPVGNLLLAALDMVASDELTAIRVAAELLRVDDRVLPSTTQRVQLVADLADGRSVRGESEIPRSGARIRRVRVEPAEAVPAPAVLEALDDADAIILGPGSLYTSLLATVVVPGMAAAIAGSRAVRVLVCNAMTEPGETDGYGLAEHLRVLEEHGLPLAAFDYLVVSSTPIAPRILDRYADQGARPVHDDFEPCPGAPTIVRADLMEPDQKVRHAPDKLGPILCHLASRRAVSTSRPTRAEPVPTYAMNTRGTL
jgi:uncharacterized cofD-like protein